MEVQSLTTSLGPAYLTEVIDPKSYYLVNNLKENWTNKNKTL